MAQIEVAGSGAELLKLFVDPDHMNRGAGRRLPRLVFDLGDRKNHAAPLHGGRSKARLIP